MLEEVSPVEDKGEEGINHISNTDGQPLVFVTVDSINRPVELKISTWEIHVIDGDNLRPEFKGQEELIKNIISDPGVIVPDPMENRERYYDLVYNSTSGKIKTVMIVVDHSTVPGDVVTIMSKSTVKESDERGVIYVRSK